MQPSTVQQATPHWDSEANPCSMFNMSSAQSRCTCRTQGHGIPCGGQAVYAGEWMEHVWYDRYVWKSCGVPWGWHFELGRIHFQLCLPDHCFERTHHLWMGENPLLALPEDRQRNSSEGAPILLVGGLKSVLCNAFTATWDDGTLLLTCSEGFKPTITLQMLKWQNPCG